MTNKTTRHGTRTESSTETPDGNTDTERDTQTLRRHAGLLARADQKQQRVQGACGQPPCHCSSCPVGAWHLAEAGSQLCCPAVLRAKAVAFASC